MCAGLKGQLEQPKLAEKHPPADMPEVGAQERQSALRLQRKTGGRKNPAAADAPKAKRIRLEAPQGGVPSKETTALGPAKAGKPPAVPKNRESKDSGSLKADGKWNALSTQDFNGNPCPDFVPHAVTVGRPKVHTEQAAAALRRDGR